MIININANHIKKSSMPCQHKSQNNNIKYIFMIIGLIFLFFMFREVFAWFCKGNHTLSAIRQNEKRLIRVESMIKSLTE